MQVPGYYNAIVDVLNSTSMTSGTERLSRMATVGIVSGLRLGRSVDDLETCPRCRQKALKRLSFHHQHQRESA